MDLTGRRFGNLLVLEKAGSYQGENFWKCQCDCGNELYALEGRLRDETVSHCGCRNKRQRHIDITGQRFERLVAIKHMFDNHRKQSCWLFQCDCGNQKILTYNQVKWGGVKSCGCLHREMTQRINLTDITGKRFDRLVAVRPTEKRLGSGSIVWECKCDCGNTAYYSVNQLNYGNIHSCGCLYKETRGEGVKNRTDLVDNTSVTALVTSKRLRADNTSGVTGIYFDKRNGKWGAYISYQRKRYYLGQYEKKEDAVKARQRAEQEFHDPLIEEHWDELPKNRQDEYLAYLKGIPIEYPPSVNI